MTHVLGNHIILSLVLRNLTSARDIVALAHVDRNVYATMRDILHRTPIPSLTFSKRRIKSKNIDAKADLFRLLSFRCLVILDLSETDVTFSSVRSLVLVSRHLKVLQVVGCKRLMASSFITFLGTLATQIETSKRAVSDVAPLIVLDVWDVMGMQLDYRYQGKREWMYESFCPDSKNLRTLLGITLRLNVSLNIEFCRASAHDGVVDERYRPAARQAWGVTTCEIAPMPGNEGNSASFCDTCMLKAHVQRNHRKHKCRQVTPILVQDIYASGFVEEEVA